jgi:hypothetical protein
MWTPPETDFIRLKLGGGQPWATPATGALWTSSTGHRSSGPPWWLIAASPGTVLEEAAEALEELCSMPEREADVIAN